MSLIKIWQQGNGIIDFKWTSSEGEKKKKKHFLYHLHALLVQKDLLKTQKNLITAVEKRVEMMQTFPFCFPAYSS